MPTENFTAYTEVDPNGRFTVTAGKIDCDDLDRDETAYVYDDKGVGHFGNAWTHYFEQTLYQDQASSICAEWAVANDVEDYKAWLDNDRYAVVAWHYNSGGTLQLRLTETKDGDGYSWVGGAWSTKYYCTIIRSGANGKTFSIYYYTDSGRTSLAASGSVELPDDDIAFRYIFVTASYDTATGGRDATFDLENLDLNEITLSIDPIGVEATIVPPAVSGTWVEMVRQGNVTTLTVHSWLVPPIYFYWYVDGRYVGQTKSPSRAFYLPAGDQAQIDVIDSTDPDLDPIANAPAAYPVRRTLWWIRSIDAGRVDRYRVEQQKDGGDWTQIGTVHAVDGQWDYTFLTDRLDDLGAYAWRVVPIDAAGNDGSAITLGAETVVRKPDGVDFTLSFDDGTDRVTLDEA